MYLCNGCYDLMQKSMNFNDVSIVSVKRSDYRTHLWYMSKDDIISIIKNSDLKKQIAIKFFQNIKDEL